MHAVEVNNLIKKYDGRLVLKGVSFTVAPGEIFGILGTERCRQDDHCRVDRRFAPSRRGDDQDPRARPPEGP